MRTIPVDLILHETALKLRELPEEHQRGLADDIAAFCIRPQAIAEEWTSGAGVAQQAAWLVRRLDGDIGKPASLPVTAGPGMSVVPTGQMVAAETRAMEVAVSRRLADCALSLLVTQDAEDAATAQTLMQAAQRVVGLATAKPGAEAVLFTSATDSDADGLSPATLRRYLAATRDALGLGSGPVFLGDIVTRAKSLADANDARQSQRLKVARDCLPPGVDIIACLRDDKPTTYKASNTGEEYDTPEAAVRAAWVCHQRPTQSAPDRTFQVGDRVVVARKAGNEACPWGLMDDRYLGQHGTIERQDKAGDLMVRLDLDGDVLWFLAASVDLVTPTA